MSTFWYEKNVNFFNFSCFKIIFSLQKSAKNRYEAFKKVKERVINDGTLNKIIGF